MILLLGDLHFGMKNGNMEVLENQLSFFEQQVFPFILENDIKEVFCLGDFFDNRTTLDWMVLHTLKARFFSFFEDKKVNFHGIVGNHDTQRKNTIEYHSLSIAFEGYRHLFYCDEISTVALGDYDLCFVPWQVDITTTILPKCDILCGHFDIIGAKMNTKVESKKGFDVGVFKDYKMVLSGHYHGVSKISNVQYLGSPYQMDWGDCRDERGFWTLEGLDLKFYENVVGPKHIKVVYSEDGIELIGGTK